VVEAAPPPPEPPPVVEPVANPHAVPDLDPLPETHLVAMGGWATPGERWRLHQRRTVAGASGDPADGVDLRFAIKQVSGKHAVFELYPSGDLWVKDLGSSNGTFVNGRRLAAGERAKLVVGDQVKLSQQLILVVERPGVTAEPRADEPEPARPAAPEAPRPDAAAAAAAKAKKSTRFDPGDR
jgi:predicted component of type VI protein secretion system